ncbi:MAG: DUF4250 domain-containing protein [Acutalibacteraceae bacterium]|nr:DUF4250 domain-containing protein [Acutalibacteraceae bacterium]
MSLPNDPFILLSFINTKLRDEFSSLETLCESLNVEKQEIVSSLEKIDYRYNSDKNQFC